MIAAAAVMLGVGLSLSVAMVTGSCAAPRSCSGGMFIETERPGSVDPGSPRTVRRLRRVEVDFGRVFPGGERPSAARAADRITLNLFPDVCVLAVRDRATDLGPGRVQWEGRVPAASHGTVTLVIDDRLMVGTVRIDREIFEIRYLGDGVHAVADIDQSKFPRD
jgi:hypothetical protein